MPSGLGPLLSRFLPLPLQMRCEPARRLSFIDTYRHTRETDDPSTRNGAQLNRDHEKARANNGEALALAHPASGSSAVWEMDGGKIGTGAVIHTVVQHSLSFSWSEFSGRKVVAQLFRACPVAHWGSPAQGVNDLRLVYATHLVIWLGLELCVVSRFANCTDDAHSHNSVLGFSDTWGSAVSPTQEKGGVEEIRWMEEAVCWVGTRVTGVGGESAPAGGYWASSNGGTCMSRRTTKQG
ncbi:hypothetical protein BC826DRAFT_972865 [Russula brevipes]|nr:hypothetical protein BC826DRAFT_972865 [Russula brevipes]